MSALAFVGLLFLGPAVEAADAPASAVEVAPNACSECHAEIVASMQASFHNELGCLSCHGDCDAGAPDSREDYSPLSDENVAKCTSCHREDVGRFSHPVGSRIPDPQMDGDLTCTSSCHDPHGSEYQFMLRVPYQDAEEGTDGLCMRCHEPDEL